MLFSIDPKPSKSKTKCLYYTTKTIRILPEPVILNKNPLPWVDVANHLGNELSVNINHTLCCLETKYDLLVKRSIFFSRAQSLKQEFGFALPKIICELLRIYGTSFYGSVLWNLNCAEYGKLIRSWNTAVKLLWDLPNQTHTRFVESLTECPHLQSMLHSRYVGFTKSLLSSKKNHVKILFSLCRNDLSTLTGYNMKSLMTTYDCVTQEDLFQKQSVIGRTRVNKIDDSELWKVPIIDDLVGIKQGSLDLDFPEEEIDQILKFITTSLKVPSSRFLKPSF